MSEQQQYETVWSGATWRDVPAPSLPGPPMVTYRTEKPSVSLTDRIEQALDGEWRRVAEITDRAGVGANGVICAIVGRLVERGIAERIPSTMVTRGRKGYLYRKVQA